MKTLVFLLCLLSIPINSFAGESGLIPTFQPLYGFDADGPIITSVMCYEHNTHVGWYQAVRYITARFIPPSLDDKFAEDVNLASLSGLSMGASEDEKGRVFVTLDFTGLRTTHGYTESQIAAAALECLRRIAGNKLASTMIEPKYRAGGQDDIKQLLTAFLKHPKDQEFRPR